MLVRVVVRGTGSGTSKLLSSSGLGAGVEILNLGLTKDTEEVQFTFQWEKHPKLVAETHMYVLLLGDL